MNRVQLVQVIVIVMALVLGYEMINNFIIFASSAVSYFTVAGRFNTDFAIYYGTAALLSAISLFVLINNAPKITGWIIEKVQPDENIQLGFTDNSVLYAIILFLTLGTLLKNIPAILYDLFEAFSGTVKNVKFSGGYVADLPGFNWPRLLESIIALILLVYIKPVVNYFQQKIDPHDPHHISDGAASQPENE